MTDCPMRLDNQPAPTMRIVAPVGLSRAVIVLVALLLAACEPEATPMPVIVPTTPPPTQIAAAPQTLRYALTGESAAFVADLDAIAAAADLTILSQPLTDADFDGRYDIIAGIGDRPGWTRAPTAMQIVLILNPAVPPLDTPELAGALRSAFFPDELAAALAIPGAEAAAVNTASRAVLREQLANAGYPDGFDIRLAQAAPGADAAAAQLAALNIGAQLTEMPPEQIQTALADGQIHGALVVRAGEIDPRWSGVAPGDLLPLVNIPISYWTVEGVSITFLPGGFPVGGR
jgi:hypothetical protein